MDTPMKIRAHHFLCIQGFQGYGYDDEFTNHLSNVIMRLNAEPNTLVQVLTECDEICNGCPYQIENQCQKNKDSDQRIIELDMKILERIEMEPDTVIESAQMIERINNTFQTRIQLADICGDCQWMGRCTWYLALSNDISSPLKERLWKK